MATDRNDFVRLTAIYSPYTDSRLANDGRRKDVETYTIGFITRLTDELSVGGSNRLIQRRHGIAVVYTFEHIIC